MNLFVLQGVLVRKIEPTADAYNVLKEVQIFNLESNNFKDCYDDLVYLNILQKKELQN